MPYFPQPLVGSRDRHIQNGRGAGDGLSWLLLGTHGAWTVGRPDERDLDGGDRVIAILERTLPEPRPVTYGCGIGLLAAGILLAAFG